MANRRPYSVEGVQGHAIVFERDGDDGPFTWMFHHEVKRMNKMRPARLFGPFATLTEARDAAESAITGGLIPMDEP